MPSEIHKQDQAQRLFFIERKILILYFVRHSHNYTTRELVKKYFSFNDGVSQTVKDYMNNYLKKHFPRQINNTPKEDTTIKKLEAQSKIMIIPTTDKQEVTRKMVFPHKFENIDLEDVTMDDDFVLAEKQKDPFSKIKVDRFKQIYTQKKTQPVEVVQQHYDDTINMDMFESVKEDDIFPERNGNQYNGVERQERNIDDEFDALISLMSDGGTSAKSILSMKPKKSILKVRFGTNQTKDPLIRDKMAGKFIQDMSTGLKEAKNNQRLKKMPHRFNPIIHMEEPAKDEDFFVKKRQSVETSEQKVEQDDVEITDNIKKKLKVVDIRPQAVENMKEDNLIMGNPLYVKVNINFF